MLRLVRALTFGLLVSLAPACAPAPTVPLRVGTNVFPGYEPLYVARESGWLPAGAVKLVEYQSSSEVMRAFRNRSIEAAALTLDEVLLLAQDGVEPRIVLVMDFSEGADALLARPALATLTDLRGRRVGVETSALGAYVLSLVLMRANLTSADITVVPLGVQDHETAFTRGLVDAVVTFEPVRSRLLAAGARELFDSSLIPGEVVDVLVVQRDSLEQESVSLDALTTAWFRALDHVRVNPLQAAGAMTARLGLTQDEVLQALKGLRFPDRQENLDLLGGRPPAFGAVVRRLADFMFANRLISRSVDGGLLIDPRTIERANR